MIKTVQLVPSSLVVRIVLFLLRETGAPLQRELMQTAFPMTAISQFPSAQNSPYAKVASSGGGIP